MVVSQWNMITRNLIIELAMFVNMTTLSQRFIYCSNVELKAGISLKILYSLNS
jgi:hypothetical protein